MSRGNAPVFEPAASKFIGYYDKVRGFIRQEVVHHMLEPFLEVDNRRILDYGGGEALDSIWVAKHGGQVDYWDNSPEMRAKATKNIYESGQPVKVLANDPVKDIKPRYDILMLHVVLQYLEPDIQEALTGSLAHTIISGGLLSLMDRNWATVEGQNNGPIRSFTNNLGLDCRVYPPKYWQELLSRLGFKNICIRGIRGLKEDDRRQTVDVGPKELAKIVAEEINWSAKKESIKTGHLLHILAVKL
ncbi:MAG: hypothetical protein ACXWLH_03300 [Candidatus Saccharimonadales bacterium]